MLSTSLAHVERELLLPKTPKETIMAHNALDSGGMSVALSGDPVGCGFTSNS